MSLKLFACGDILNTTNLDQLVDNNLAKIISGCDISICNLEGPIQTLHGYEIPKAGPHVYQLPETIKLLKSSGFNYVTLANNHILDYGEAGLKGTIDQLNKFSIGYIGAGFSYEDVYSYKIINKNGITIALIAACENEFGCLHEKLEKAGYPWLFSNQLDKIICKLGNMVDFIILNAHAGVENINFPIKEWRERYQYLCELGVDVIIGHHPHVPHGIEKFCNSIIFYSLGNFYFDYKGSVNKSHDSFSVILSFFENKNFNYEVVYHKKLDGVTTLVSESSVDFSLDYLNSILEDKNYDEMNNAMSVSLFQRFYYNYYMTALDSFPKDQGIIKIIKHALKKLIYKTSSNELNLLLLHNIRIDSHRFVTQRALSIISEGKK